MIISKRKDSRFRKQKETVICFVLFCCIILFLIYYLLGMVENPERNSIKWNEMKWNEMKFSLV